MTADPPGLTVPALRLPDGGVRHGFFTRRGGVSSGPFSSLNCSLSSTDNRDAVLENRARAARVLGAAPDALVGLVQVHGADVAVVDLPWKPGKGPRADAMVTARPGVALGIGTADCAPVLLSDPVAGVVGGVHAGWRGAAAGVLEATVAAMVDLGARAGRIAAAVGPCIGATSYEVAADMRDAVLGQDADGVRHFRDGARDGRWLFDLSGYCAARLGAAEVGTVACSGADTFADEERFWSHRRRTLGGGGAIGHQLSAIVRLQNPAASTGG